VIYFYDIEKLLHPYMKTTLEKGGKEMSKKECKIYDKNFSYALKIYRKNITKMIYCHFFTYPFVHHRWKKEVKR